MKIVVTGGAGFIGSHIVDRLLEGGHELIVIDNMYSGSTQNVAKGVKVYEADICDREAIAKIFEDEKPDAVTHQAAQMSVSLSVRDPIFDAQNNIMGLLNTLEAAAKTGCKRFVFASSGGVLYGDVTTPAPESTPANPISPYGITKWMGERYLKFFSEEHGMETAALRYSNVYGPRQNPYGEAGVVAIFSKLMLKGESPRVDGDGKYDRDYVYGPDVAQANYLVLTEPLPTKFNAFNIGTGVKTDVNQLAGHLRECCQSLLKSSGSTMTVPEPVHGPERPGDLRSNVIDASLIHKTFGWKPSVSIAEGLNLTATWFYKNAK